MLPSEAKSNGENQRCLASRRKTALAYNRDLHPLTLRGILPAGGKTGLASLNFSLES